MKNKAFVLFITFVLVLSFAFCVGAFAENTLDGNAASEAKDYISDTFDGSDTGILTVGALDGNNADDTFDKDGEDISETGVLTIGALDEKSAEYSSDDETEDTAEAAVSSYPSKGVETFKDYSFPILVYGMLGIFLVLGLIAIAIYLLSKAFNKKDNG